VTVTDEVRRFAEEPAAFGEIDPETGFERMLTDSYCLLVGPVPSFTQVSHLRVDPDAVAEVIHEVRAEITRRRHRRATWHVGSSASPADLVDRLRAHGLVADDHNAALVLSREPAAGPAGVVARRVESLEEFALSVEIAAIAFESEHVREWADIVAERFELERAGRAPRAYLGFVDGEPVASAQVLLEPGCPAGLLVGGAVLPAARGRGAYRALVRARWDDALAAGFEALCVHAGAMSRPILERLGFECVAEIEVLADPATC
jgi:GNAT superfamily N-acetyltransferase